MYVQDEITFIKNNLDRLSENESKASKAFKSLLLKDMLKKAYISKQKKKVASEKKDLSSMDSLRNIKVP